LALFCKIVGSRVDDGNRWYHRTLAQASLGHRGATVAGRAVWRGSRSEREQVVMSPCAARHDESSGGRPLSGEGKAKLHTGGALERYSNGVRCRHKVGRIPQTRKERGAVPRCTQASSCCGRAWLASRHLHLHVAVRTKNTAHFGDDSSCVQRRELQVAGSEAAD
jgi:hypothetical protein